VKRIGSVWSLEKLSLVVVAMTTVTDAEKDRSGRSTSSNYGLKSKQFLKTQVCFDVLILITILEVVKGPLLLIIITMYVLKVLFFFKLPRSRS
jgi:hypothetical protein